MSTFKPFHAVFYERRLLGFYENDRRALNVVPIYYLNLNDEVVNMTFTWTVRCKGYEMKSNVIVGYCHDDDWNARASSFCSTNLVCATFCKFKKT